MISTSRCDCSGRSALGSGPELERMWLAAVREESADMTSRKRAQ